jgi:hypothetical protein
MNRFRTVPIILVSIILLSFFAVTVNADPTVYMDLEYRGEHGGDCEIDVTIQNIGSESITVENVTVILICPLILGPAFSDPNVTYDVFLGEHDILPGGSYTFSDDGGMPDWDVPQLSVMAYIMIAQGSEDPQQYNVTSYVSALSSSNGTSEFGDIDWMWALVPLTFIMIMAGFWFSYYSDRPYWDIWVKEKVYDEKSNFLMRWRWFVYRWMDEGKGSYIVVMWVILALIFSSIVFYMIWLIHQ